MVASFHCCGTSPPVHTSRRMAWKCSRTMGSVGSAMLSSYATRESGPSAFQLCIPRITRLVSSSVGADPSGTESLVVGAAGRCCTSSMMAGFSLRDLVLRRVAEEPRPPLEDLCLVPQQNTVLVLNVRLPPRLPPAKAHRFIEVFVQASQVAILVHRF